MKYRYIFHCRIPRLDRYGEPVLDPETEEPIINEYPFVIAFTSRGKKNQARLLAYNDQKRPTAHIFNTKQQFKGYLRRTKNYYLQSDGVVPYWLDPTNIVETRILGVDRTFEFNQVRLRNAKQSAKEMAKGMAEQMVLDMIKSGVLTKNEIDEENM